VNSSVNAAGLPSPRYWDSGIRFTVRLDSTEAIASTNQKTGQKRVTIKDRVFIELTKEKNPLEVSQLATRLDLKDASIRTALKTLLSENRIESLGGRGKDTTYQVVKEE
jgi:Fic family protein